MSLLSTLQSITGTLGPALLQKTLAKHFKNKNSLHPDLLATAIAGLEKETARPLEPYPDWTRPCPDLGKNRTDSNHYHSSKGRNPVKELQDFMADPGKSTHDFRYAQSIRSDLENLIARHHLDLDHLTLKKGTPHTLRCTKNDNSHHRALKRRKDDQTLLKKLRKHLKK